MCVDSCDVPQQWFTALLVVAAKRGKVLHLADSYGNIGSQSCRFKALTLVVDRGLREGADDTGQLSPE